MQKNPDIQIKEGGEVVTTVPMNLNFCDLSDICSSHLLVVRCIQHFLNNRTLNIFCASKATDFEELVSYLGNLISSGYNLCTFCAASDCHIAISSLDDGLHEIPLKRFSVMLGLIRVLSLQVIQAVHRGQIQ